MQKYIFLKDKELAKKKKKKGYIEKNTELHKKRKVYSLYKLIFLLLNPKWRNWDLLFDKLFVGMPIYKVPFQSDYMYSMSHFVWISSYFVIIINIKWHEH